MELGALVEVRGSVTRELRARVLEISDARERYIEVPHRRGSIFASIAESMWVLAGRNDLSYLLGYVPSAGHYSDDGLTWRAGYGPRLRDWNGVDQLAQVVAILNRDRESRQAVMTIFDPDRDFVVSRDIPCNNWLHFISREGVLDLHVAARSTDLWWGFSGINAFEWTLLLEMVAYWTANSPGRLIFFASSLHIYERHFERAAKVLEASHGAPEQLGHRSPPTEFQTKWSRFPAELEEWMRLESAARSGRPIAPGRSSLTDPLLVDFTQMIDVYWAFKFDHGIPRIHESLAAIQEPRLAAAAAEYLFRPRSGGIA